MPIRFQFILLIAALLLFSNEATVNKILVSSKKTMPFAYPSGDGDTQWEGFSMEVFRYCIANNFVTDGTTTYSEYEVVTPAGQITGNIAGFEHLNNNNSRIYIAAPTMTYAREQIIDFTLPFFKTGLGVAITVDDSQEKRTEAFINTLFNPETLQFLFGLLSILWACSCLVWSLEMVGNEEVRLKSKKFFNSDPKFGMVEALTWSFFTLITPRSYKPPNHPVSKRIGSTLSLLTVVFAATITSLITNAMLAQPNVQINKVEDIGNPTIIPLQGRIKGTSTASYLLSKGMNNFKEYETFDKAIAGLKAGDIHALVYDKPMLQYEEKLQATAVNANEEKISDTNKLMKTLPLQFDPQEYGFVLKEHSSIVLKEKLGECVLMYARDPQYEIALNKYFSAGSAVTNGQQTESLGGTIVYICLWIFPSIGAYFVVNKNRKAADEKDHEQEIAKVKMKRLGLVNKNDIFELLCSIMEGQADIMDLVYRTATKDETYDGKSITMKEIHERQQRLFKTKQKVLNLRQGDVNHQDEVVEHVKGLTSKLKSAIITKASIVKIAWKNVKGKLTYENEHEREQLEGFLDNALDHRIIHNMNNSADEAMKIAHGIWDSVKVSIPPDEEYEKVANGSKKKKKGNEEKIQVGSSDGNSKKIKLPHANMNVSPKPVNKQDKSWNDKFDVKVSGHWLTVTRKDSTSGWGQQLVLSATRNMEDNINKIFTEKTSSSIDAIDHFFELLGDSHKKVNYRWKAVFSHMQEHSVGDGHDGDESSDDGNGTESNGTELKAINIVPMQ
jgi:ABC-type amino acid transport substrate-binding protein